MEFQRQKGGNRWVSVGVYILNLEQAGVFAFGIYPCDELEGLLVLGKGK